MSRLPHRSGGLALLAVLLATVPLAAACGAGQNAETKKENFAVGAFGNVGTLRLRNVQLHPASGSETIDGSATLTFAIFNQGQQPVRLTGIGTGSGSRIQAGASSAAPSPSGAGSTSVPPSVSPSVTVSASASASASRRASRSGSASASTSPTPSVTSAPPAPASVLPLTISAGGGLTVDPLGATPLTITGLDQGIRIGRTIELVFQFEPGGTTRLAVPVTPLTGTTATEYAPSLSPTSYPEETIDPNYEEQPFDQRSAASPSE